MYPIESLVRTLQKERVEEAARLRRSRSLVLARRRVRRAERVVIANRILRARVQ